MRELRNATVKPRCAVCNKDVDLFWWIRNPAASNGAGEYIYIAKCHGEAEQVTITDADIMAMPTLEITLAPAFAKKMLP